MENCEHLKIQVSWQTEKRLVVRTKVRVLEELTDIAPYGIKLTKEQIKEAINRLKDFLVILEYNRPVTKGAEDWHFTLKLWHRRYDKEANLKRFDVEWEHRRSERSTQFLDTKSLKTSLDRLQTSVLPESAPRSMNVPEVRLLSNRKLVVLKLWEGSFEQGFPVTLQIGEDERHPCLEIIGKLPPIPEIPQYYDKWSQTYRDLGLRSRLEAAPAQVTNYSQIESCCSAAQILRDRLNGWLDSEPFRPIREKLLEQLMPSEDIRLIIQTDNPWLRRLPWHLWNFCDRYPKAEIALSSPIFERPTPISSPYPKVRILAILGNSAKGFSHL